MLKTLTRILAFFGKEVNEVRRQPMLVLSLILGPFIILALFGLGYQGKHPPVRVSLVIPEALIDDPTMEDVSTVIGDNFDLVETVSDRQRAVSSLYADRVDLIIEVPDDLFERLESGEQAALHLTYREINPQEEQYLRYIGFTQTDAMNEIILINEIAGLQAQSEDIQADIERLNDSLDHLEASGEDADPDETLAAIDALQQNLSTAMLYTSFSDTSSTAQEIEELNRELDDMRAMIEAGEDVTDQADFQDLRAKLQSLEEQITALQDRPPHVIVSPLTQEFANTRGEALDLMTFFAPGVAALILQHIAVTLGALSLVRERVRGTLEFFGVSPASMFQVLLGKYFAFVLFVGLIAVVLTLTMILALDVPFLGSVGLMISFVIVFLIASLSVGFFISLISNSQTQAVQLAMLVLLMTVFFSGFVLPLDWFRTPFNYIGYLAPMTQAMPGFQEIMLSGEAPSLINWAVLGGICLILLPVIALVWRRQGRRLA